MERLRKKKTNCKDLSSETNAEIIHTLPLPITMQEFESWVVKKADREKKMLLLKYGIRG